MKQRRNDLLFITLLLAASACLWAWNARSAAGGWAVVTVDGAELGRYSMGEDREIPIQIGENYNLLVLYDGAAAVTDANCGDHTCVRRGAVSRTGETIVCLPHRLVVEIIGATDNGPDAVAGG